MVGGLIYLTHTRPNILSSINMILRFMYSLLIHHLGTIKSNVFVELSTMEFYIDMILNLIF